MEANIQIKKAEVEGNKIKNIEFYGDWDSSDIGGSGPIYVDVPVDNIETNTLPKGVFTVTSSTWTNAKHQIKLKFNANTKYSSLTIFDITNSAVLSTMTNLRPENSMSMIAFGSGNYQKVGYAIFEGGFDDLNNIIGYIYLDVTDGTESFVYKEV